MVLAPNRWIPETQALLTAVNLDEGLAVDCRVTAAGGGRVRVDVPRIGKLSAACKSRVKSALARMLRLDEDLSEFHANCRRFRSHANAAKTKFGRLLRSATLFEDVVKTICSTNITWRQTVNMVAALAHCFGVPTQNDPDVRAFPTPDRIAAESIATLKAKCKLGYRAEYVRTLARRVGDGKIDLAELEASDLPTSELHKKLRAIKGIGDYGASNICMLLGRYDRLAFDTELKRHYTARYPRRNPTLANIQKHYARHHPYQFLAYWYEVWTDYTKRHGPADQWTADDTARRITERPQL